MNRGRTGLVSMAARSTPMPDRDEMPVPTGLPPLTPADVALEATRFPAWFPLYRKHTPKSTIIALDEVQPDFVDWLEEDGLILPRGSDNANGRQRQGSPVHASGSDDGLEDSDNSDEETSRDFTALNARIQEVIDEYDGGVFPKLDWSAPSDAAWIVPGGTLRCSTPADVYLLLKSSDFVAKDVTQLRELASMEGETSGQGARGSMPHLVLKKYFAIPTSHEFRCFVRAGRLVAISQRDAGTFFEHLQAPEQQLKIRRKLQDFHGRVLWPSQTGSANGDARPATRFPIADFVWDAYLTRDQDRVFIIDINPYLERTDALLWTWPEIEEEAATQLLPREGAGAKHDDASNLPPLRLVTSRASTMQSAPTHAHNMLPSDVVGLSQGSDIAGFARDFHAQLAEAALRPEGDDDGVDTPSVIGR